MGDVYGNIGFFEIGPEGMQKKPLFLVKTTEEGMGIGNICFNKKEKFMLASTDKKFVILNYIERLEELVGEPVEVKEYLNEHYGKIPASREVLKTYKDVTRFEPNVVQNKPSGPKKIVKFYRKSKDGAKSKNIVVIKKRLNRSQAD